MSFPETVFPNGDNDAEKTKSCRATFIRKRNEQYVLLESRKFQNSLLMSVALLELGNASDFAANVWNRIPVPIYAMVLMAIGGTVALSMTCFAILDARLSWRNIQLLREERRYLCGKRADCDASVQVLFDSLLEVNRWELGTEIIERMSMDVLMGSGCVIVGIGTLMAIGGANPVVFHASNLLSGYIGNSPAAFCGVLIAVWCAYMWVRSYKHGIAQADAVSKPLLKRRMYLVQMQSSISATTGIVAGVGSMLTAVRWYGYVILIPCILSFIFCNYAWRKWIAYSRRSIMEFDLIDQSYLVGELKFVTHMQRLLTSQSPVHNLIPETSAVEALDLISRSRLFEEFCSRLLQKAGAAAVLGRSNAETQDVVTVELSDISALAGQGLSATILETAHECIVKDGLAHFQDRQRHILEVLGSYYELLMTSKKQ
ncbi:hypothetical protein V1523DRAFT_352704 [Lipomyces doorenjongii]